MKQIDEYYVDVHQLGAMPAGGRDGIGRPGSVDILPLLLGAGAPRTGLVRVRGLHACTVQERSARHRGVVSSAPRTVFMNFQSDVQTNLMFSAVMPNSLQGRCQYMRRGNGTMTHGKPRVLISFISGSSTTNALFTDS